uniref:Chloride channel protein n=2 Tax=Clytia hemisphaerica TaxID=252671 RepID=A0A7M5X152_9CNID|eukprot:TCONS_00054959-protein
MGEEAPPKYYGYEENLMHGRYNSSMADYTKEYSKKLKYNTEDDDLISEFDAEHSMRSYSQSRERSCWRLSYHWKKIRPVLANDYSFLLILGILMALISFGLDYVIQKFQLAQILLYKMVAFSTVLQYILWVGFPLLLICFSVGFVHLVSPHAIGSGIPEMKVILRGTVLKRYLSFQTFIAKTVGLMTALGSGIPIGKEGPFVHVSSIVARMLSKFIKGFHGIYVNEARNVDMLACACALGVSSSFAAPIGGVLFAIEVTSTYFAVRNYWRGFFTAVCGAFMFRLLAVLDSTEETITALFKTTFNIDFPFDVQEFVAFGFIGLTCGLAGALFVYTHRKIVDFSQRHEASKFNRFLAKSRFIYPAMIVIVVSTLSFPKGFGMFMAGQLTPKEAVVQLFSNSTWTSNPSSDSEKYLLYWRTEYSNVYMTLVIFILVKFILTALCIALPIPAGAFFPVFVIGAAYGRLVGECMATWFPDGIRSGSGASSPVLPGGYAVVGAAAMAGAVTHTISTSVIVFELTGQITHILPVMVAVLIANAVVQPLQPSIYDSIIEIKKLPNIPDIKRTRHYNVCAGDIMQTSILYTSMTGTYMAIRDLLKKSPHTSFPLVDKPEGMILLGSVRRPQLEWMLQRHLLNGQMRNDNTDGPDGNARHASVHFSSGGEVSIKNLQAQQRPKKKTFGSKLKTGTTAHPVSLQRLFNTSTSEMGESVATHDFSVDNSQVRTEHFVW